MEKSAKITTPADAARERSSWEERFERLVQAVRRYRPEDREALRRFQGRFFGAQALQLDAVRVRWLHEANPWMDAAGPELWLWEQGGIVGQQAGIVHRLKIGSEEVRASWAVDLMVDPAWRLRGVGPALSERHARSHPVAIGLGATPELYPSLVRAGWTDLGDVPQRIRMLRLRELRSWWRGRPVRGWLARCCMPTLAWGADRWGDVSRRGDRMRLEGIAAFDERADAVWRLVAPEHVVLAYRDAAALRWRFDLSPDAPLYRRFLLLQDGIAAGYLVLRDGTMLEAPVIFVVDYLCPLRLMDAMLALLSAACREMGAGAIVCNALHQRAAPAFRRAGFYTVHWEERQLLWKTQPGLARLHPLLRARTNWFVTRADSDWDRPEAGRSAAE